ncbi:MAG: hypothetical protein IJQ06_02230 [Paludibacteraceae bacterium]|nr:hypothetical protein [Paludibacteraceae bacterium]
MRKTLLMLLTLMLSTFGWSATNYYVSVSTSDSEAGYVSVDITNGDVDGETYHDTDENGGYVDFEVRSGRKLTLTAVVNDESLYRFVKWEDNSTKNPRSVTVRSEQNITAYFEPIPTYFVYASADPAVAVDQISVWSSESVDEGDGYAEVYEGATVYLEIDPDYITPGYEFIGWYDGEEAISGYLSCQITSGAADKTYTAKFREIPTFTITIDKNIEGGEAAVWLWSGVEADGDDDYGSWITVNENSEVYLYAEAMEGYRFLGWFIGDEMVYGPETEKQDIRFTPTKNETYTAKFEEIPTYTVTVIADLAEGGNVSVWTWSGADPIEEGYESLDDEHDWKEWITVQENTELGIYADTISGYRFLGWFIGDEMVYRPEYSGQYIQITPTADVTYTAKFEEIPTYTVTVIADLAEGGDVETWTSSGADPLSYDNEGDDDQNWVFWISVQENTEIYIWASPLSGYRFLGWYDGETQIYGPEYNGQLINITLTSNITYTAKFEKIPVYTISVSTNPAGLFDDYGDENPLWICDNYKCNEEGTYSLEVVEGDNYEIYASPTGYGLSSFLKFDRWECSDGTVSTSVALSGLQSTQDVQWVAHYVPDFGTYTQVGTTNLYSYDNGSAIDIKGMDDNKYYGSTFSDGGYQAAIKVGDNAATNVYDGLKVDDVQVNTSVLQSGAMARIVYRVSNTGSEDAVISLGTHADVQIGRNDAAPIEAITDDNGDIIGIKMQDGEGGQLYIIFGLGAAGSTLIDDHWFGFYSENTSANQMIGNYTFEYPQYYLQENGNYDSGMGWCWKNRTIAAGQTVMYSFMVGIGEVKMEPSASVILTPLDLSTWNDLSATHSMYAEGIYTHTTGVDGYLEYQVESTDADGWTMLATDPVRLSSDADFHGTFDAKFDASKAVHTIHFRTRDILGNITSLPSVQYQDLGAYEVQGEVVDKVYNGEPQTQDVFISGVQEGKYTIAYTDNINAGTAHVMLAGNFPHTIGYKEYTYTIAPKPLEGPIVFTYTDCSYTGYEWTPGWYIAGFDLVAGKDYTAAWSNNILPGTASLKVTGKGNYTGSLSANFLIDKATLTSGMYSVTIPKNALYDGALHTATASTDAGIGNASFSYRINDVEKEPADKGSYDVYLSIAENDLYYGIDDEWVGSFTIWRMDPAEWAALQAIYTELSTRNWKNRWDMSKGEAGAGSFQGLSFYQGHVVALDLSDNEIDGNFPLSTLNLPYLSGLDLSNNNLSGDIENGLGETEIASLNAISNLAGLDISNNELEGNIGLFVQALPKLESLDASYNHIEEVVPMLSTGITELNLNNQVVLEPRVFNLPAASEDYTELLKAVPTIMLYNHSSQNYLPTSSTLVTLKDDLNNPQFAVSAVVVDFENKLWTMNSNGQDNVFRYTSEDVLYVTNEGSTSRFSAKLLFGDGDANFTGTTDVLDLQASINFIFGEYDNARPYNFTAADLFKDEVINVQDIVLLTNILLADEEPSPTPARRMMAAQAEGTETEAELRWERGELHLMSNKPVAALDLVIETDEPIEWQAGAHSVMTKQTRNGQHAVIYSLAGAVFAADTDIVIARAKDLTPRTTKAVLADKEAMPITVRTHMEEANVPTGVDNVQSDNVPCTKVLRDGVLYIIHNGTMYNVQGQLIKK